MTISVGPRPKLRVTVRSWTPGLPHAAQTDAELQTVDGNDEERTSKVELDDRFSFDAFNGEASDNELVLARLSVPLARNDFACKEDAFDIKDREVVIVKFFRGMERHRIVQGANTVAYSADGQSYVRIVVDDSSSA